MVRLILDTSLVCVAVDGVDADDPIAASLGKPVVDLLAAEDRGVLEDFGDAVASQGAVRAVIRLCIAGSEVEATLELDARAGGSADLEPVPRVEAPAPTSVDTARFRALAEHDAFGVRGA